MSHLADKKTWVRLQASDASADSYSSGRPLDGDSPQGNWLRDWCQQSMLGTGRQSGYKPEGCR